MNDTKREQPWLQIAVLLGAVGILLRALLSGTGVRLTETYVSEDGPLHLVTQRNWIIEEPPQSRTGIPLDGVRLSDGTELMYVLDINPGQISGAIAWGTSHDFFAVAQIDPSSYPNVGLRERVEALTAPAPAQGHTNTVHEIAFEDNRAVRIDDNFNYQLQNLNFIVDLGNNYFGLVRFSTLPGEMEQFEPTILAIVASLRYTP